MPSLTPAKVVDLLDELRLLEPEQIISLRAELLARPTDLKQLVQSLVQRGWLTTYQAKRLVKREGEALRLGAYLLLDQLGEGGMGLVYKARHRDLGRVVALKMIRAHRLDNPEAIKRFHREIRAAAQLRHPNIVHALDADQVGEVHFFTMEYVEGKDLARLVNERGPLPVAEACDYVRQAALGLQHAFERGLVHRDVKPSNLLWSPVRTPDLMATATAGSLTGGVAASEHFGQIKLLDLGLARLWQEDSDEESTLTREGMVMGTPDYIAPEQARSSHVVDVRADLYSLGCTLYFLLTGLPPFPHGSLTEKLLKHQLEEPVPIDVIRDGVPPGVVAIVKRLMAKKPSMRFQTPAELAGTLTKVEAYSEPVVVDQIQSPTGVSAIQETPSATLAQPTEPGSFLAQAFHVRRESPRLPRQRYLVVGGTSAAIITVGILTFTMGGRSHVAPEDARVAPRADAQPRKPGPAHRRDLGQRRQEAREAEEQHRLAQANAEWQTLVPKVSASGDVDGLREELIAFVSQHAATPAAAKALHSLARLPSALDQYQPGRLPEDARAAWRALGWRPPEELVGVLGTHSWQSPSGVINEVIVGKRSGAIYLHDVVLDPQDGHPRRALPGSAMHLAVSPDERYAAASFWTQNVVQLWDLETGTLAASLEGHAAQAWQLAFTPDGKLLASSGSDGTVRLWNVAARKEVRQFPSVGGWAPPLAIAPDGTLLAALADTQTIKLWNLDSGAEMGTIQATSEGVRSLAFSPKGNLLAVGSHDGFAALWDVDQKTELAKWRAVYGSCARLAFSTDGGWLATGRSNAQHRGHPGNVAVFDVESKQCLFALALPDQIHGLAFDRNGKTLMASCWADGKLHRFATDAWRQLSPAPGFRAGDSLALSLDGRLAASGTNVVDLATGELLLNRPGEVLKAFSPDGRQVLSSSLSAARHFVIPVAGDRQARQFDGGGPGADLSADGRLALLAGGDNLLQLIDVTDGALEKALSVNAGDDNLLRIHPAGRLAAVASSGRPHVLLIDLESGKTTDTLLTEAPLRSLAFSWSGSHLAAGAANGVVYVWQLSSGGAPLLLQTGAPFPRAAFAPDGRCLAVSGADNALALWSLDGKKFKEWRMPLPLTEVAFASDGRHVVLALANGTLYVLRIGQVP